MDSTSPSTSEVALPEILRDGPTPGPGALFGASLRRPPWSIVALAWVIRLAALLNLCASILPQLRKLMHLLGPWVPFEVTAGKPYRMFLMGAILLVLASGLMRGKRVAWLCMIVTLAVAPILHFGHTDVGPQIAVNLMLIVFLILHQGYFVTRSDGPSVRFALVICPVLSMALLVFGTIRLHKLREETSGGDDWWTCAQTAVELVLVQNTHTQEPQTATSFYFFSVLRIAGTSIALVGLCLTLRPVLLRQRSRDDSRHQAERLIEAHGRDPFDPYALLPDKHYFFTEDGAAVVPYVLSGGVAVALANPIGSPARRARAIGEFAVFCQRQDWEPVFYALTEDMAGPFRQAGFSLFKIGEGARLRTEGFDLKGGAFQNLRTLCNRARKLGLRFRWYDASQGTDLVLERQLEWISQSWIASKKAREMAFDMGSYSREEIRRGGVSVVVDSMGNALAFATWRPFRQGTGRALDLMRHQPDARNVMDFVLVESIRHFHAHGVTEVCLGLAPLANTEAAPSRLVAEEKVVQFLFKNLNSIYGYKSLFEFKRKYRPAWLGHYVAYRRGVRLPMVGLALVRVHAPEGIWKFLIG